ncbi:MAG: elongation factor G [Elusimicrobia bacterium]|nr:elongation factor G [Elusimicrobiota bacterium]
MKTYETKSIRNTVILGHNGAGKTSLAEALLFTSQVIGRMGRVEDGNTVSDYQPEETKRKISITGSLLGFERGGAKYNFLDVPGYNDFFGETISSIRAVDSALFVFCGVNGAGVGAEKMWKAAKAKNLPVIAFINKMDDEKADFDSTLESLKNDFGKDFVPVQVPIGKGSGFSGLVDLIKMKAYAFENGKEKEIPMPKDSEAEFHREQLIEGAAESDETLLNKYLEGKEISQEEIVSGLKNGIKNAAIVPVLCGSAIKNIGVSSVLDFIRDYGPAPDSRKISAADANGNPVSVKCGAAESFSGFIFKTMAEAHIGELNFVRIHSGVLMPSSTTYNSSKRQSERIGQINTLQGKNRIELEKAIAGDIVVLPKLKVSETNDTLCVENKSVVYPPIDFPTPVYNLAVKPKSKEDQDKIGIAFNNLKREDQTFKINYNAETKETVISGMGDAHLDVVLERFRRQFNLDVDVTAPKIPYKETIKGKAQAQGKYKRQTGGHGQYGDCWILLEPLARGQGFEFVDKIVGGAIPRNYIPAVEKGVKGAMDEGVISGYPVVDLKVTVYDGSYHEVDSSDMAFKIAGSLGFKKAFQDARPTILEPIMILEVNVPKDYIGGVTGDLNKRRGRIISFEESKIAAQVPLAEISQYSIDLRSITRGFGNFGVKFSHYEEAPSNIQEALISKYSKERAKEEVA